MDRDCQSFAAIFAAKMAVLISDSLASVPCQ